MPKSLLTVNVDPRVGPRHLAARRPCANVAGMQASTEQGMDFNTFVARAWDEHAADSQAMAHRLSEGIPLLTTEHELTRLMDLAHHVHGQHLGTWRAGAAFIERLAALPPFVPEGVSGQARRRCMASLAVCERADADLGDLSPSDRIRVAAMAASNLAEHDTPSAMRLLQQALGQAESAGLAAADPMHRALAVAGNSIAVALEEKTARSADERGLMILAAQAARCHWAIAGTWLETERAEYRLAIIWLQAGDLAQARTHAQNCLEIVAANDGAALERLFGWEALGRVERAAGNAAGHAQALLNARTAFAELAAADQAWCAACIDQLAG